VILRVDAVKLNKRDIIAISIISLVFFSLASWNLGLTKTPVTYWHVVNGEQISLNFEKNENVNSLYILINSETNISATVSALKSGVWTPAGNLSGNEYYKWVNVDFNATTQSLKLQFEKTIGDVYEVVAIDSSYKRINIADIRGSDSNDHEVKNLVDEQQYFENPPTFKSETYFDEIYYVKTAQEYLSKKEATEWTQPPLGKLIIAAGIEAFSFSPFGWRILGVIFAMLMIPLLYILAQSIFDSRVAAILSASLMALEFMHFTMGRIATIDTYLVFFSIISTLFFYKNYASIISNHKFNFKFLALGIFFFYLAFSVKWTALFGLMGQMILITVAFFKGSPISVRGIVVRFVSFLKPLLGTLILFVMGSFVYLSTYIPYAAVGHSLGDIYNLQWSMFTYHSQLQATHPFSSEWWSWPFIFKPLWLYFQTLPMGIVSTITAMGNPVIWWVGFPILLIALWRGIKEREPPYLFIGILYMSQWIPYAFISRSLFIYHFYPDVPITVVALAAVLSESWNKPRERKFVIMILAAALAVFIIFFPVISGFSVPIWYTQYLRIFKGWVF
jgi:4-amino-4-deoxy-L-arabinose transferase-like glycosyltransferase